MTVRVDFHATKIQFNVTGEREDHEKSYDRLPDVSLYLCMLDLVSSSDYRLGRGPRLGYIRGETFFSIVRNVVSPCTEVRTIKEIGDAVLMVSAQFRPIFECMLLIERVSHQLAAVADEEQYPFQIRGALNFGLVKRLKRLDEDYLGTPIDHLSMLLNADCSRTNLFIHDSAYEHAADVLNEYSDFLEVPYPLQLPPHASKNSGRQIYYRELIVNHKIFGEFGRFFSPWEQATRSNRKRSD